MLNKFTSRKFWLSVAAFLGSIATSIAGIAAKNDAVTIAGIICGVLSVAIYSACEAYVDAAAVDNTIATTGYLTYADDDDEITGTITTAGADEE